MSAVGFRFLTFVVIVAFLAGCTSSNQSPSPSPSLPATSSTTSSTPSPEPTQSEPLTTGPNVRPGEKPPEFPAMAKQHTANGARVFVSYYIQALDWSFATNNPFLLRRASAHACFACQRYIGALTRLRRIGGIEQGGRVVGISVSALAPGTSDERAFKIVLRQAPIVLSLPSSPPKHIRPANPSENIIVAKWVGNSWKIASVAKADL
jgi:hypothetical protein